ncbi:hypothetical protein, partial [Bradyrhizobium sp.]|uniref:hypothetical protein n=1 Tax=Bradyrhizobium sp. TaxID=376 RepID=UPI0025B7C940
MRWRLEKASELPAKILAKFGGKCNLFDRKRAGTGLGSEPKYGGIAVNIPSIDFDLGEDISLLRDTLRA